MADEPPDRPDPQFDSTMVAAAVNHQPTPQELSHTYTAATGQASMQPNTGVGSTLPDQRSRPSHRHPPGLYLDHDKTVWVCNLHIKPLRHRFFPGGGCQPCPIQGCNAHLRTVFELIGHLRKYHPRPHQLHNDKDVKKLEKLGSENGFFVCREHAHYGLLTLIKVPRKNTPSCYAYDPCKQCAHRAPITIPPTNFFRVATPRAHDQDIKVPNINFLSAQHRTHPPGTIIKFSYLITEHNELLPLNNSSAPSHQRNPPVDILISPPPPFSNVQQ